MVRGRWSKVDGQWSMVDGQWSKVEGRRSATAGTLRAFCDAMKAKTLDEVIVYQEAHAAAEAISAILSRPVFGKDFDLKDQLSRSSARIAPLIAEGFGQLTDRHLATYLGRARGSALETHGHLQRALSKQYIAPSEFCDLAGRYVTIGKRLTRWINYLQRSDWKQRG